MISCQNCFPNGQKCQNQFTTVIICFIIIVMWLCGIILCIGHLYLLQNSIRDISLLFLKRLSRRFPTCSEPLFIPNSEPVFMFPTRIRNKTQFQYILKLGIKSNFDHVMRGNDFKNNEFLKVRNKEWKSGSKHAGNLDSLLRNKKDTSRRLFCGFLAQLFYRAPVTRDR